MDVKRLARFEKPGPTLSSAGEETNTAESAGNTCT
jgi:hypothetical protein